VTSLNTIGVSSAFYISLVQYLLNSEIWLCFCSKNDASPEAPNENQPSGLEAGLVQSVGDATRRRAYFHMREPSPPAKRTQINNEDDTGANEDQTDDSKSRHQAHV
ncbi:hypothetical protein WUBG_10578, partial [Wuchereria bancrofti]